MELGGCSLHRMWKQSTYVMNTLKCLDHSVDVASTFHTAVNSSIGHLSKYLNHKKTPCYRQALHILSNFWLSKVKKQTCCTGFLWSFGFTNSVQPNFLAEKWSKRWVTWHIKKQNKMTYSVRSTVLSPSSNLLGFRSTPMILDAPAILAPSAA